jgi:uncharacterized SAM-binding protein YcdF (DUF218 family)
MLFLISKALWTLVRPSSLLVVLAALGIVLGWTRWRRLSRILLLAGIGGLLALLLLPLDQWAMRPLEDRFARPDPPPAHVDGIIVLGGAILGQFTADRGLPTLSPGADRITEFVTLARRYPQARLVFTGGGADPAFDIPAEADQARPLLADLGLPAERVVFEAESRTTWENAVLSFQLLHPRPDETWLLVTSASHMPRSVGTFRAAGWRVVPWPVGYKTTRTHVFHTVGEPFGERLARFDWAVHEWIGMVAYWLLGHSSAPFPAPA